MKHLYTIFTLLLIASGYAQSTIDFETGGVGDTWTWVSDTTDSTFEIVDNPFSDATNGTSKVGSLTMETTTETYGLAFSSDQEEFTFSSSNAVVTMQVYKSTRSVPVTLKFENTIDPTNNPAVELTVKSSGAAAWETLSFNFFESIGNTYDKIVIIPDNTTRDAQTVSYFDNITFSEYTLTTFIPTSGPGAPSATGNPTSIFSNTLGDATGLNIDPDWSQATDSQLVNLGTNDDVIRYTGLNYQGTQFDAVDVDAYEYFHVDYYIGSNTLTDLDFFLISPGSETSVLLNINTKGEWVSVDIDLAEFADTVDLTGVFQFKVTGSGSGTVYFDNWYFHGTSSREAGVADIDPTEGPTAPTTDSSDVISVYSDTYTTAVSSAEFGPNWGQGTIDSDEDLNGNTVWKLDGLNYVGINLGENVDVSAKQYLHLDYWISTDATDDFSVYLINSAAATGGGAVEQEYPFDTTSKGQWVSVDIDLQDNFSTLDLSIVDQMKFESSASGTTVYIDNIYFHGTYTAPTPNTSVDLDFTDASDASNWTPSNVAITPTHQETGGNPGGALAFGFSEGGTHRISYTDTNFDYTGAATARFTFDILQTSTTLTGTAVHFRYSTSTTTDGVAAQDLDIQNKGINATTWTSLSYDETVSGDSDLAYMSIEIAMGTFATAEGSFLLDNVAVTLLDENGDTLSTYEIETPQQFITYPNPLQNTLNVRGTVDVDQVSIYDLMGRNVLNANPNKSEFSLDVSQLNKGVYMVQLKAGNKETTLKIVK